MKGGEGKRRRRFIGEKRIGRESRANKEKKIKVKVRR